MGSSSWVILVLLVVAMLSYLFPNWKEELQSRLANLMSSTGETLEARLKATTVKEKKKAEELQKVLDAKRELAVARATNTKLRKEIAGISETNVKTESLPLKRETRQKTL